MLVSFAFAQNPTDNLLFNGGFETGEVFQSGTSTFKLPSGWSGGFTSGGAESWSNLEPTGGLFQGQYRTSGRFSYGLQRNDGSFTAWIYQRVPASSGALLDGRAFAYVVGGATSYVALGIDPTGGTNIASRSIIWQGVSGITNQWIRLRLSVLGQNSTATIFLYAKQDLPYNPNAVYWDEVTLTSFLNPTPAPTRQNITGSMFMNANAVLNVRSGPSEAYPIIGSAIPGDIYTVIGQERGWFRIDYLGKVGYVAAHLVTTTGAIASEPEAALESEVTYTAIYRVNLRSAPSTDGGIIDKIPAGATVRGIARTRDNQWLQVSYLGNVGWVAMRYGAVSGNIYTLVAQ
jgi:uncharacterized protein YgiM (DUF1202 family)